VRHMGTTSDVRFVALAIRIGRGGVLIERSLL
jgi:hypothetical protein